MRALPSHGYAAPFTPRYRLNIVIGGYAAGVAESAKHFRYIAVMKICIRDIVVIATPGAAAIARCQRYASATVVQHGCRLQYVRRRAALREEIHIHMARARARGTGYAAG